MHWLFWVFSGTFLAVAYRLGYKLISDKFSPLLSVAVITLTASIICFTLYFLRDYQKNNLNTFDLKSLAYLLLVGVVVAGLEISIMMMYRSGGPVSISQSLISGAAGVIIFAIGIVFFKEQLNLGQAIGFIFGLTGIVLMTYFSRG